MCVVISGQEIHSQPLAQAVRLLQPVMVLLGGIDVGIIKKGGDGELFPQQFDDVGGARSTADVEQ
jgi:hypothetical protein